MIEKHHMIPVSLYGPDENCNLMELGKTVHANLHRVLDIPTTIYSKRTRQFKKDTNGKTIRTPKDIDMVYDLQATYFDKIDQLPRDVQQKHIVKIREYMQREMMRALQVGVDEIQHIEGDFENMHLVANTYKREKHRIIIDDLKKIY